MESINRSSLKLSGQNLRFRHTAGKEPSKSETYFNLLPSNTCNIACSDEYWAIPYQGAGGPVYVSSLKATGKVEPNCPVINGQKAAIQEISFSPFHSSLMATGSLDCTVAVWKLGTPTSHEPIHNFTSHGHSVKTCNFHPLVDNLLCSSSQDLSIIFHDVEEGKVVSRLNILQDGQQPSHISFNYDGSILLVDCKDRSMRMLDPRSNSLILETDPSLQGRNMRSVWCTSSNQQSNAICSVSAASNGLRYIYLWDARNMNAPVLSHPIDNASGQLYPMYDEDTQVCYVAGKGDTVIRWYELSFLQENQSLSLEKSADYQSMTNRDPITGICLLPKSCCDVMRVETARMLKQTTDSVIPIHFYTPRADVLKTYFQDDLFPETRAGTCSNTSIMDWMNTDMTSLPQPNRRSLCPESVTPVSQKPAEAATVRRSLQFRQAIDREAAMKEEQAQVFSRLQNLVNQSDVAESSKKVAKEDQEVADEEWDD